VAKRRKPDTSIFPFEGIGAPNVTPVPDIYFDLIIPELTESELRVLLYIIRRTFGFKKNSDPISFKQLVKGIKTKNGKILDKGTGMSKSAVWRGVNGLIEKSIITVEKKLTKEGDNDINVYSLKFKGKGVVLQKNHPSSPEEPPVVLLENPQYNSIQNTVKQQQEDKDVDVTLINELIKKGITRSTAELLAKKYPDRVQKKVEVFDYLVETGSDLISKNPSGFLRKSIEEDYQSPPGFRPVAELRAEREAAARKRVEEERKQRAKRELQEKIEDVRATLSPQELQALRVRAEAECEKEGADKGFGYDILLKMKEDEHIQREYLDGQDR
jgi:hypothetical protein